MHTLFDAAATLASQQHTDYRQPIARIWRLASHIAASAPLYSLPDASVKDASGSKSDEVNEQLADMGESLPELSETTKELSYDSDSPKFRKSPRFWGLGPTLTSQTTGAFLYVQRKARHLQTVSRLSR